MSEDTENKILNLLSTKDGYERGFSLLVKTYQERLYWHIRGMLGQHDDADEVLQKTFIKVFKGIAGFQRNSKLYTWLYRIASNESLSFLAKKTEKQTRIAG
jgi:RNA polymerase sigma-70 factor (ECF subfamily)